MGQVARIDGDVHVWNYDKRKRVDAQGVRWHFVVHQRWAKGGAPMMDGLYEVLFRDREWNEVGIISFPRMKDNPYKYDKLFDKLMSDLSFRHQYLAPETAKLWNKNWK